MDQNEMKTDVAAAIERIKTAIADADAVMIGAGAGLSTAAGFTYSGERFEANFSDFEAKYGFHDMYTGGFYPFETPEIMWAYWSRNIMVNRYQPMPSDLYERLLDVVRDKDYFVLTTNVDHCFQRAGFDKTRLFYTQGDYGLFQCSVPCHKSTYDNEVQVRAMYARQSDMRIPSELIPRCPRCGSPMTMNLRSDDKFVEDEGWHEAAQRYERFANAHQSDNIVYLEIGVGGNTPGIIKFNFWQQVYNNPKSLYICLNYDEAVAPNQILNRSILVQGDSAEVIRALA